ncbi:MAG: ribbon-helix-helix domain-containing protein [Clostridium butyricum]
MDKKYGLKTRVRISNAIDKELWRQLKDYADETNIPISKLLDKSISLFLESISK